MKREEMSVVSLQPGARFRLGISGALQVTVAAVAIATGTAHDLASILFMVLGAVGLGYIALAVSGRLPGGSG
jgi:hypothetical protein